MLAVSRSLRVTTDGSAFCGILQVMEMVGMDTEWMLNDLLACADAVYA